MGTPRSFDDASLDAPAPGSLDTPAPGSLERAASIPFEPQRLPPEPPGRYRPAASGGVIGRGGIGIVLRVWDEVLQREVACKVLAQPADGTATARFLREARATAGLQHPGIIPVYDLGERPGGLPYYTMKYVRGLTLAAAIARSPTLPERLRLLGAFVDLCQAIAYAHSRGVLHRDLKPANVMVGEFGETVVLDWGLARVRGEADPRGEGATPTASALTMIGAVLGTPVYMSPEQAEGRFAELDERADTWSLGVVLYEILAGHPPFSGDTEAILLAVRETTLPPLSSVCPGAPPELAAVVEKALSRAPADRYAEASALAADVEAWRSGVRVSAYTYSSLELLHRFAARHRLPLTIAAVAVLALLALGAGSYVRVVAERNRALDAEGVAAARAREAMANLSDALVEKALGTPEIEPFAAELYAAGALAQHEHPDARGVIARAHARWTPTLVTAWPTPNTCGAVAWLPDGGLACLTTDRLSAWRADGTPIYDVALERPTARLELVVSPDEQTLAVGLREGVVALIDARTGGAHGRLALEDGNEVQGAMFSADGLTLLVGMRHEREGRGVAVWSASTGERRGTIAAGLYPDAFTRAPDGTIWATIRGGDSTVAIGGLVALDPERLAVRAQLPSPALVWGPAWSPDGRWLAAAGGDGRTLVWDGGALAAGPRLLGDEGGLGVVRWSEDGGLLVHAREDGSLTFRQAGSWTAVFGLDLFPQAWRAFAFRRDRLAIAGEHGIAIWRLGALPPVGGLFIEPTPARGIRLSSDGATIVTSEPKNLAFWGIDGAPLRRDEPTDAMTGAELAPDGDVLLVAGSGGLRLLDATTGALRRVLAEGNFLGAGFAEGGRLALAIDADGAVTAREADGVERWRSAPEYAFLFVGLDGPALVLAKEGGVALLSTQDGAVRGVSDGEGLFYVGLSHSARRAVLSWRDGHVSVIDTADARELERFAPYGGVNRRVTVSDDGRYVAAGGADRAIRVWDRDAGRVVAVLRGHRQALQDLSFSADARRLLSTAWGGEARDWDLSDLDTPGAALLDRIEGRSNLHLNGARLTERELVEP